MMRGRGRQRRQVRRERKRDGRGKRYRQGNRQEDTQPSMTDTTEISFLFSLTLIPLRLPPSLPFPLSAPPLHREQPKTTVKVQGWYNISILTHTLIPLLTVSLAISSFSLSTSFLPSFHFEPLKPTLLTRSNSNQYLYLHSFLFPFPLFFPFLPRVIPSEVLKGIADM